MTTPAQRDERSVTLRWRCLQRKSLAWLDYAHVRARSLKRSESIESWQVRRGLCTRDILSGARFEVDDLELLMGRLAPRPADLQDADLKSAADYLARHTWPGGQNGHCELDLSRLCEIGIDGLAADVRRRMNGAGGADTATGQSFLYALEGLSALCEIGAQTAEAAVSAAGAARKVELREMAESCRRVAHRPPDTFRDAIQILWLTIVGLWIGEGVWLVVPGHLDRTLAPFYERDLRAGRLDRERALLLIEALYVLINELVPDGLAVSVMVGGRDACGKDVTNELSYLSLEALRRTKLVYPTVGVCWHEGTPGELIDLATDLIGKGYSNPAFFGDETIQKGLRSLGVPGEQACHYINSTCVEITPSGASNVWVASPYFNTCGCLREEIAAQVGSPAGTFAEFLGRYHERLAGKIADAVKEQNELRIGRQRHGGKPLQSVFTRDCLGRMRDIDNGGALYNWVECSFVGLANLADSLNVIRGEVFAKQQLGWGDLKKALDADFAGSEELRQRFMNAYPKYGQGNPEADRLVGEAVEFVGRECARYHLHPDQSPFVPGAFVWIMHEQLGRQTGATPDGRRAGFPFADGCGPAQGRESRGPTAAILSTTSWDHSPMIGGLAYNMKFNTSLFKTPEGFRRLRDLILTFLRRGGLETQVNVVDAEVLRKARQNPEEYRDLVVRIGGYTDYFTRLSPEMQDEVMMRTEFAEV